MFWRGRMIMKRTLIALVAVLGLLGGGAFLFVGCEDDGGTNGASFSIQPSRVTLSSNDLTVVLMVSGGHSPYTWSVSDTSIGSLSGSGERVTYTRTDKNGVNTVTVVDDDAWRATAVITQEDTPVSSTRALAIVPSSASVLWTGGSVQLDGVGGKGPSFYQWKISTVPANGQLTFLTGAVTIYTSTSNGNDTVVLTDTEDAVSLIITKHE